MGIREVNYGRLKVVRLGGPLVSAHLLVSDDALTLIDTGLWGIPGELRSLVRRLGRSPGDLRDIVLTHGHLDHTGGAAEIQAWSGARVWVHPADREHVEQRVNYTGLARGCGTLERAGVVVGRLGGWRYQAPEIGGELRDGDVLPFAAGLRVWHLPGHTPGHCALVAEGVLGEKGGGLVFSGDVFASYSWSVHRPPAFLTRERVRAEASLRELAMRRPVEILPSHYDRMEPGLHAQRLTQLASRRRNVV